VLAASIQAGVKVLHFAESKPLQDWLARHRDSPFIALVDYELLREQVTGLDIIEREGIAQRAILVTSRFAEPAVLRRASALGLKILPKGLVGQIPIVTAPATLPAPAAVTSLGVRVLVIDDDEMIAWGWRKKRQRLGIAELATFASMEDCETASVGYESFDLAFVDLNIQGTTWPIDKTISHLRQRGVRRVFIASGAPEAVTVARDQKADRVAAEKIPEDLAEYIAPLEARP